MTGKSYNQETFDFEVDISSKEEDFLIADSNSEAMRWVDNWKSWSTPSIVIYGPRGCGKTHLANIFIQKSGAKNIIPEALTNNSPQSFLENSNMFVYVITLIARCSIIYLRITLKYLMFCMHPY